MKASTLALFAVAAAPLLSPAAAPEPLGPSSRRTPIAISEIMYKPAARPDLRNVEFVELYNSNPWSEDISGYRLSGDIQFTFPPSTSIGSNSFIVVAAVPADVQAVYGLSPVFGPYTNSLKTSGTIRLLDEQGSRLLGIEYDDSHPWPMGADGTGHSIVLAAASYGENDPRAWALSQNRGGSPRSNEVLQASTLRNVVINEILAHTDPPLTDAIELYNHSNASVGLNGCVLTDDPTTNKFVISTTISARGFVQFTESQLGFSLNAAGETVYFKSPAGVVIDAIRFSAQENGVSFGRYPNGSTELSRLRTRTLGANNTPPLVSAIGLNEIMYHPISNNDDDQYIELFNSGTNVISLQGWKLGGGISFTFGAGHTVAPNSFLVIGRNTSRLLENYPQLNTANTVGNFSGKLSGKGERLTLSMPDTLVTTNNLGLTVTNLIDIILDEVTYGTGGRWGRWSDGGGSSLELRDPRSDKRLASNWADSDETQKAPWTIIEATGVADNGSGAFSPLQVGLLDAGECLVDDVEAFNWQGLDAVNNGGFENGMTSLAFVGNHSRSSLEPGSGYGDSTALRVRTADALMTGPNGIQIGATNAGFGSGQVATLRFKARWLRGCPEPLLRFWGCYLEATGRLPVPANLGTPGLPNSQLSSNAAPAIYQVSHSPAVPTANQAVVVTARVSDPDGLSGVTLQYRLDPATTRTSVTMNDSGSNGDNVAGDGIYSATIPARISAGLTAFILQAADTPGATSTFPEVLADNAPERECAIYFGSANPTNYFGTYHLWLTQTNVNRWKALPTMSNEDIDGTLVYNNRVIYNMGGRYAGGPFHQSYSGPSGTPCHYVWTMPKDDLLLGFTSFNQIHWPGNEIQSNDDPTLQREQAAYMLMRGLGIPWMYRRFVAVYCNGVRRGKLLEDACRPTASSAEEQYFPGETGAQLVKLQRWYEGSSPSLISECRLAHFTTTNGERKTARYRPNWALKDTTTSLSDFTNIYTLITATLENTAPNYSGVVENVVDVENWMRFNAANHAAGNWDAFGFNSGQNVDAWISAQSRWKLFIIDFSICLDNGLAYGGLFGTSDTGWSRMLAVPKFNRMYYRALNELASGVMQSNIINPVLDAKYAAFVAAGVTASSPSNTKNWIANRRSTIITALAGVNSAPFSLATTEPSVFQNSVTLSGTAPIGVTSVLVNGISYTPNWTSLTNWTLLLPVPSGTNNWDVQAYDRFGNPIGGPVVVTIGNPSVPESPVGNVVLNEILFNTSAPEAEYIELYNRSGNTTFDLSGWTVNGIDYTFPSGSVLSPGRYLVLARSSVVFAATYNPLIPVFGTFDGNLQADGETLSLIKPGATPELDIVVDRVRYEAAAPWPPTEPGMSLQLIDRGQDNSRVANWTVHPVSRATPGSANSVAGTLPEFPPVWLNEIQVQNQTGPHDNFAEREPWIELYNSGTNSISLDGFYLGTNYSAPNQWAFPAGSSIGAGERLIVWLDGEPDESTASALHAGFRLDPAGSGIALGRYHSGAPQILDYLNFQPLPVNYSYGDIPDGQPFYRETMFHATPGGTNTAALPALTIAINEWMAENVGYLFDSATAKYEDWFELYNPASFAADLSGYYLTDDLTDPFQFQIPAGYSVPPQGFLLVWADSKSSANSTNDPALHISFKLNKDGDSIALFNPDGSIVDAVVFSTQTANVTEGRYPDAGGLRLFMPAPSPAAPNILPPATQPPSFTDVLRQTDGTLVLSFATEPGHTYRVEYKDDLSSGEWQPAGPDLFASGNSASFSDHSSGPQRFYRIRRIE